MNEISWYDFSNYYKCDEIIKISRKMTKKCNLKYFHNVIQMGNCLFKIIFIYEG